MDTAVIFNVAAYNQEDECIEFAQNSNSLPSVLLALRIRAVETSLYQAFGRGQLHGTIHTCVGQEFTGALICSKLQADDFVTSNHRCHGHFIATSGDWRGLVDEIIGNRDGVCAGIGSSQHLCADRFISNGQQGGLLPVAAGIALERKHAEKRAVVVSFIGEGTLGEGTVYETLNLTSLWRLPHLVVCENNGYSQSTPQSASVAGNINLRAESSAFAFSRDPLGVYRAGRDGRSRSEIRSRYATPSHAGDPDLSSQSSFERRRYTRIGGDRLVFTT